VLDHESSDLLMDPLQADLSFLLDLLRVLLGLLQIMPVDLYVQGAFALASLSDLQSLSDRVAL
jgi:hypothetical protein